MRQRHQLRGRQGAGLTPPRRYFQALAAIAVTVAAAPLADSPVEFLRAAELGLSVIVSLLMVEAVVLYVKRYHRAPETLAATPYIFAMLAASYLLLLAGATLTTLDFLQTHEQAHALIFCSTASQVLSLLWLGPLVRRLNGR